MCGMYNSLHERLLLAQVQTNPNYIMGLNIIQPGKGLSCKGQTYSHVEPAHLFQCLCYFSFHGRFQVMALVPVVFASVIQTGRGRTAIVLLVQTPVCPAWGCCAAVVVSVCVGAVSALSLGPTAPPATNAPPALTPAP